MSTEHCQKAITYSWPINWKKFWVSVDRQWSWIPVKKQITLIDIIEEENDFIGLRKNLHRHLSWQTIYSTNIIELDRLMYHQQSMKKLIQPRHATVSWLQSVCQEIITACHLAMQIHHVYYYKKEVEDIMKRKILQSWILYQLNHQSGSYLEQ